ncbi:hypothetical protein AN958_02075, partial [Leucoagaricus sp. SymC.cos]
DESTRALYGSGLLVYHVFCDVKDVTESEWAPISHDLLASFITLLAGVYSGATINNYICGVRAWHLLHNLKWEVNKTDLDLLIHAAEKAAPPSSKKLKQVPFTTDYIISLKQHLALDNPLHAAVFACLTTAFYGTARLGELTVPSLNSFDPAKHVKPSDVREETDRQGRASTVIHIPQTKTAKIKGEDIYWSRQNDTSDPQAALDNHLQVNQPMPTEHLFTYTHKGARRPLTKKSFLTTINAAARVANLPPRSGHTIRSGSTLEYLLQGVPFEAMKAKGRWASDAFSVYLTRYAQVLSPYMQAQPELHTTFLQHTIPNPRNRR